MLTPQGRIIDLPQGATPLDFAYAVHTEVGHRCRGAKVNGRIVPLTYTLHNGEQVEILTTKHGRPSRDWLNPTLGYAKTGRARSKIRQWFRRQDREPHQVLCELAHVSSPGVAHRCGSARIDGYLTPPPWRRPAWRWPAHSGLSSRELDDPPGYTSR